MLDKREQEVSLPDIRCALYNAIAIARSPAIQIHDNGNGNDTRAVLLLMLVQYMGLYRVGFEHTARTWFWCMFEIECVIAWYTMHPDVNAFAHSPAIQTHYNGNDTWLRADIC